MKYWYIYFECDQKRSWRIWKGRHPVDRLIECPHQIPMFWQELPESIALEAIQKLGIYDFEKDLNQHEASVELWKALNF